MTVTEFDRRVQHEFRVRGSRTFILGAGFSAGAGIPLTGQLLSKAMELFAAECPGLYSRVEGYVRTAFSVSRHEQQAIDFAELGFSDLCTFIEYIELKEYGGGERWSDSGSREKLALKFYLAKAIALATPAAGEIPPLYLEFARQIRPSDLVITFNWDCLLEAALNAVNVPFRYQSLSDTPEPTLAGKLEITKLHGSINWRLGLPRGQAEFRWRSFGFASGMMKTEVYCSGGVENRESWVNGEPLGELEPLIVLPGYGKAIDVRHLAPLWYRPENGFGYTHDVNIVGLSLAPDDFFIRSFFLSCLPFLSSFSGLPERRIRIINPDVAVRANYRFLDNVKNVDFIFERFQSSHVSVFNSSSE